MFYHQFRWLQSRVLQRTAMDIFYWNIIKAARSLYCIHVYVPKKVLQRLSWPAVLGTGHISFANGVSSDLTRTNEIHIFNANNKQAHRALHMEIGKFKGRKLNFEKTLLIAKMLMWPNVGDRNLNLTFYQCCSLRSWWEFIFVGTKFAKPQKIMKAAK